MGVRSDDMLAAPAAELRDAARDPARATVASTRAHTPASVARTRIVVLGGAFGGLVATRHLERMCGGRLNAEITLVSRDNFFVLTPLLFEACSGRLELRHCAQPIRPALRRARFVEATVEDVNVEQRVVRAVAADGGVYHLPYDQLVVALGATPNESLIPGSSTALTFKTMADALLLRNHVIEQFERADATSDPAVRSRCLSFVVVGGGLVGVELLGELTAFAVDVLRYYPRLRRDELHFHLFEAGPRILPEIDPRLAAVAQRVLERRGADIRASTPVRAIEPTCVHLANEHYDAGTIVVATGIVTNPVAARIPVAHDERGRIAVDATMRSRSDPNVWALGDCAEIPGPDGRPYPALAQHAMREAKQMARNVAAAIDGRTPAPFIFHSLGTLASLGHSRAVAQIMGVRVTGFPAWFVRRTYYLLQMPRWDRRLRIVLDWTVALFFRPDITKIDITPGPRGASQECAERASSLSQTG
ncbi:MAG TPA: NAD(P)/FAD-dependent oxidoreductase [Gemmatimonadaceae bacterium]|jgi:NADH dehydrogenase|nr:NAD(P)/FAD-dependent oxidoreductase [Gemmatimonadaceae bacterium]